MSRSGRILSGMDPVDPRDPVDPYDYDGEPPGYEDQDVCFGCGEPFVFGGCSPGMCYAYSYRLDDLIEESIGQYDYEEQYKNDDVPPDVWHE